MNPAVRPGGRLYWSELACHDEKGRTFEYPQDWRETRALRVDAMFHAIRAECSLALGANCPLTVLEAYRTEAYQAYLRTIPKYKAAKHSQHCEGLALDLACPRGLTFDEFVECVKRAAAHTDSPIRYVEIRRTMNYIHVDGRATKKLVIEEVP